MTKFGIIADKALYDMSEEIKLKEDISEELKEQLIGFLVRTYLILPDSIQKEFKEWMTKN